MSPDSRPSIRPERRDFALVTRIREGSQPAWQDFMERYSGVVHAVVRRYLFDDDDRRDAWTAIFTHLHDGGLDEYAGRSSLATWLTVVSRGIVCDYVRGRMGRRGEPRAVAQLDTAARRAFQLLYLEGRYPDEVRTQLGAESLLQPGESMAEVLSRVDAVLGSATLRRIAYDLQSGSVGSQIGRMLEYCDQLREDIREREHRASPEEKLHEKHTRETIQRIHALMDHLPEQDREVLERRFGEGQTARRIADDLGLGSQRAAYTLIDRSVRELRRLMGTSLFGFIVGLVLVNLESLTTI